MELRLTPDGRRYLAAAQGHRLPSSFHLRWLLPLLLGVNLLRWVWVSRVALVAMLPGGFVYGMGMGLNWQQSLFVAVAPLGLAGVFRFPWSAPILVDPTALCLCVWAGALAVHGWWPQALVLTFVAAGIKEPSPFFVAVFAWNPLYLVALVVPLARWLFWKQGEDVLDEKNAAILAHPLRAGWEWHKDDLMDASLWVLPWGVLLVGLSGPSPQLLVALALGYAQCVIATDTVRLYQWSWPVLAVAAATVIPIPVLLLAAVAHWANPWRGSGV